MLNRWNAGTRMYAPEADGASEVPTVEPSQFMNPEGDKGPKESSFAEWGNDVEIPEGTPLDPPQEAEVDLHTEAQESETPAQQEAQEPETTEERPAEAAPVPEESIEKDAEIDVDAAIDAIAAKYNHEPEQMSKAIRNLQRLTQAKGDELNAVRGELESQLDLIDSHFTRDDQGKLVLRVDRAAERLQQEAPTAVQVDRDQVLRQVTNEEYRKLMTAGLDAEDAKEALQNLSKEIHAETDRRVQASAREQEAVRDQHWNRARERFESAARELKLTPELRQAVSKWYERFPKDSRAHLMNEGWLPVEEVARVEQMRANMREMLKEAYAQGRKAAGSVGAPEGTPQGEGGTTPRSDRAPKSVDDQIIHGIVNAGRGGAIERLFGGD